MTDSEQKTDEIRDGQNVEPDVAAAEPVAAGAPPPSPAPDPLAEMRNQHLRLQADFDNYRRRTARDHELQARRATEQLLRDLLPVLDHLDLGLESARKHHVKHAVIDGLAGVQKQFLDALAKHGVAPVATVGQPFNPDRHECVIHTASDQFSENVIAQEVRRGFTLGPYVLRAAQVIVSTGPGQTSPTDSATAERKE